MNGTPELIYVLDVWSVQIHIVLAEMIYVGLVYVLGVGSGLIYHNSCQP